jgi:phosphoglycerate dehydrogenase-like enzyme
MNPSAGYFSTIADGAIRCLPHAVASDRRVMCAALHQSILRALGKWGGSMMDAAYPIGFIGLGTMGEAMALTLIKAGTRLLVWNRTRAKAEILAAAGADVARETADVFARSATVFLMLVATGSPSRPQGDRS